MTLVRVVAEFRGDAEWRIRTDDLPDFRDALGLDLLSAFCRCYIHADRLESLGSMFTPVLETAGRESTRGRRDFMAFFAFVAGTLRELHLGLNELVGALRRRGVYDVDEWVGTAKMVRDGFPGLKKWQDWGGSASTIDLRDMLAFHVDPTMLRAGVKSFTDRVEKVALHEGDHRLVRDSWFRLAHISLLEGASFTFGDLGKLLDSVRPMLNPKDALDYAFLKALERCGLKPTVVIVSGTTPLPPIDEQLPAGTSIITT
jgi:hypothetical protein